MCRVMPGGRGISLRGAMSVSRAGPSVAAMSNRIRRSAGVLLALVAVFALFGGLFVPIEVILRKPAIGPAPESWIFAWFAVVGLAMAAWPGSRADG